MYFSVLPFSILLLCIRLHDSLSCVRSFGCRPCASQFPSSLPIYLASSFLSDDSFSSVSPIITSAHCEFASCLSSTPPFPLWAWVGLFVSGLSVLLWFPFLSSCSLHLPFSFCCLFIYLHREGWRYGLSGWIDGWREATGEGIWAFDGRSCQSGYYLKDCLVRYCKKVLLWKNCWLC